MRVTVGPDILRMEADKWRDFSTVNTSSRDQEVLLYFYHRCASACRLRTSAKLLEDLGYLYAKNLCPDRVRYPFQYLFSTAE